MAATLRTAFACVALLLLGAAQAAADAAPGGGTTLVTVGDSTPGGGPRIAPPVVLAPLTVDPADTRPGATVDLRTFADCGGVTTGQVSSEAFAAPVGLALAADGGLYAQARIAGDAAPGTHLVREVCSGRPVAAGQVTVVQLSASAPAPAAGRGWRQMPAASSASADVAASASGSGAGAVRDGAVGILLVSGAVYSVVVLRRRVTSADV
ncbi:hypothetical protein [Streptacidiphilus sp. MAP5-3]|uniref:hypothetical protein n=1 Tax=unclassified Streptacidiphilus TaxID=2643834 RepID=UPI003514232A